MMGSAYLIIFVMIFSVLFVITNAFAEELEWKSEFSIGILPYDDDIVNLQITSISSDSLQLDWKTPEKVKIAGYQILRKNSNSDYQTIVENTHSQDTKFIDTSLPSGYYGYKVIPIPETSKPEPISLHGLDRKSNLFSSYKFGQELLAIDTLNQTCKKCFDESFSELSDIKYYIFPEKLKRSEDPILQKSIENEIIKSKQMFEKLFKFKINF